VTTAILERPATDVLSFEDIHTVHRLIGAGAPWCAAGIGANQLKLNEWAIAPEMARPEIGRACGRQTSITTLPRAAPLCSRA